MAKVKLVCDNCGIDYEVESWTYNQSIRNESKNHFCCRKCLV